MIKETEWGVSGRSLAVTRRRFSNRLSLLDVSNENPAALSSGGFVVSNLLLGGRMENVKKKQPAGLLPVRSGEKAVPSRLPSRGGFLARRSVALAMPPHYLAHPSATMSALPVLLSLASAAISRYPGILSPHAATLSRLSAILSGLSGMMSRVSGMISGLSAMMSASSGMKSHLSAMMSASPGILFSFR